MGAGEGSFIFDKAFDKHFVFTQQNMVKKLDRIRKNNLKPKTSV